jgi:hypothetical protein
MEQGQSLIPKQLKFHSFLLLILIGLDFATGIFMFIFYSAFQRNSLLTLDLLILNAIRSLFLYLFVRGRLVKLRIPIWTAFGSLLYLVVRSKFATTLTAFFTLGFAFIFSWLQLLTYFRAILLYGDVVWEDAYEIIEETDDFIFPQDSSYGAYYEHATPTAANYSFEPLSVNNRINETSKSFGTSAPISIAISGQFASDPTSKSLENDKISDLGIIENFNVYKSFIKRNSESVNSFKYLLQQDYHNAKSILMEESRHLILPRYAMQFLLV